MPLGETALEGDWCARCIAEEPPFDSVRAAVHYTRQSGDIVIRLKYGRRTGFARLIARHLQRLLPPGEQEWLLVPVPLHASRLRERGFNQSLLISRHLGQMAAIAVEPDLIRRTKRTRPLKGLNPAQRDKEVRAVFKVDATAKPKIKGRKIILVDDVFTSGATARACARQLKRAGASEVIILCWARVVPDSVRLDSAFADSDMEAMQF